MFSSLAINQRYDSSVYFFLILFPKTHKLFPMGPQIEFSHCYNSSKLRLNGKIFPKIKFCKIKYNFNFQDTICENFCISSYFVLFVLQIIPFLVKTISKENDYKFYLLSCLAVHSQD